MFSIFNLAVKIAAKAANTSVLNWCTRKYSSDTMELLMWMMLNDIGEVVLTWTKRGTGREQDLLIHPNSVERKNRKDFPAFIENHKCEELNSTEWTAFSLFISVETSFATGLFGYILVVFIFFYFFEMLLHLSNESQRLWVKLSYYLTAFVEVSFVLVYFL